MGSDLWSFEGEEQECDTCCITQMRYAGGKPEEAATCASHSVVQAGTCEASVAQSSQMLSGWQSQPCCTKCSNTCAARDCNETELELTAACNCGGVYIPQNHSWSDPCREMCRMNDFCRSCDPIC